MIKDADKLFKNKDYQAAKLLYLKAGALTREKWPQEQITSIDKLIDEQIAKDNAEKIRVAREEVINGQYRSLVDKAKLEFDKGNYILARKLYTDASKLKPTENLPKEKIVLIQTTLDELALAAKAKKDSLAKVDEEKKKYMLAISKGKSYLLKDDLANAKLAYTEALNIRPEESEAKTQLKAIEAKLDQLAKVNQVDNVYDQKLATADSLLILKSYNQALSYYNAALKIKPDEYYPKKQINYVTAEIKNDQKIKEELARFESYRKEEELEQRYRDALKKGKDAMAAHKYDVAKVAYNEVLSLRPGNEYALHMITVVDYQMEKLNLAKVKNENSKKAEVKKPISEKKDNEISKVEKPGSETEKMKTAVAPSNIAELTNKYPNIDFTNLPPEQPFNGEAVNTIEKLTIFKNIVSENPRLNISTTESKVKLTCQGINFEESSVYLKFLIQNQSKDDFLTGAMMLTWTKKSGTRIKLYPIYLYPAFLPVIAPGNEATVIYVCKSYLINDKEKLNFELNDRLNKIKFQIEIPGNKFNKEEERY